MQIQAKTSACGHYATCEQCVKVRVWIDTTDGHRPGPTLCGQECYDEWTDAPYIPAWATD